MKKFLILAAATGLAFVPPVMADSIGVFVGGGQWSVKPSGSIAKGIDSLNIESDLGLNNARQGVYYIAFEHPVPLLPNFKIQRQDLGLNAVSTLTRTVNYGGSVFNVSDTVTTNLDLGNYDLIFYYQVMDNWVSLDLGVNVKYFNGSIDLRSSTNSVADNLSDYIPLLYARAKFELPATNFAFDFEGSGVSFSGDSFTDLRAALVYEIDSGFNAELGYRRMALNVNNISNIAANVTFGGAYFNLGYHF